MENKILELEKRIEKLERIEKRRKALVIAKIAGIVLLIVIPSFILGMYLCFSYLHYKDATDYAKKHNVSFETAWNNTKPDDEDCF